MNHSPIESLSISGNYVSEITDGWNNNFSSSSIFTSDWQTNPTSNAFVTNSQNTNLTTQTVAVIDRADFILHNSVIPSSASIDSTINLKYQVKNQGTSSAIASTAKFYLSPDKTLSDDEKYLSYDAVNIIAAGVNTSESTTINIDNSIFQADNNQVVSASNARNNIVASALNITPALPDLIIQNVVSPNSTIVGNNIQLNYQVKNQGSETAFSSYTLFYLSQDKTISDDDFYLGSDDVNTLIAGANSSASATWQIPNNIATGSYYLILQVDGNGDLLESNENNNIFTQAINITQTKVDLIVQKPVSPTVVTVGDKFTISYQIKNQGVDKSLPTAAMFYLSQDKILSQNDLYLGYTDIGSLAAGAYPTKTSSLRIGKNIAAGRYYLLYKADGYNSVIETNESNNIVARAVTVKNNFRALHKCGMN